MSVLYKFRNVVDYEAVKFDGVYISASDLKAIIAQQKKLTNCGVLIMDEETQRVYKDEEQIPKNTKVIITRTPLANNSKRARMNNSHNSNNSNSSGNTNGNHNSHHHGSNSNHHHHHHHHYRNNGHGQHHHQSGPGAAGPSSQGHTAGGNEAAELVSTKNMSEEEKIKQVQNQSTKDFDPSRYARGGGRSGFRGGRGGRYPLHEGYRCRKCGNSGHSVYDCKSVFQPKVKKAHGIPRDFLMKADPKDKGALMTPSGEYAVPILDAQAYSNPKIEKAPFFEDGISSDDIPPASGRP